MWELSAEHMLLAHAVMHSGMTVAFIENKMRPIEYHNERGRDYRKMNVEGIQFLTQNLCKDTVNTRWVLEDLEHRSITWATTVRGKFRFEGRVRTWLDEDGQHIEVVRFYPQGRKHVLVNVVSPV